MSDLSKRILGTFVAEDTKGPVAAWFQEQLRHGALRPAVQCFIEAQAEPLDLSRLLVDSVTSASIHCRIPHFAVDHESPKPFRADVEFEINPLTGVAARCP